MSGTVSGAIAGSNRYGQAIDLTSSDRTTGRTRVTGNRLIGARLAGWLAERRRRAAMTARFDARRRHGNEQIHHYFMNR